MLDARLKYSSVKHLEVSALSEDLDVSDLAKSAR